MGSSTQEILLKLSPKELALDSVIWNLYSIPKHLIPQFNLKHLLSNILLSTLDHITTSCNWQIQLCLLLKCSSPRLLTKWRKKYLTFMVPNPWSYLPVMKNCFFTFFAVENRKNLKKVTMLSRKVLLNLDAIRSLLWEISKANKKFQLCFNMLYVWLFMRQKVLNSMMWFSSISSKKALVMKNGIF